ncbi:hypothetical protein CN680_03605 [Bacillus pseudomycoides]|nr:hypothetical protein CN680_03605 [Bacillus pseudomycoides]PEP02884.1 hypothetical protein CN550_05055 [Bacillus pseudomycoides]
MRDKYKLKNRHKPFLVGRENPSMHRSANPMPSESKERNRMQVTSCSVIAMIYMLENQNGYILY